MKNKLKVLGVIPARMKSSRFYGKPLEKINNIEMIKYVYDNTIASTLEEVYVATDHLEIYDFCERSDIPCVMTADTHKNCSERTNEVATKLNADYILEIQGDEPTLKTSEINLFLEKAKNYRDYDFISLYTNLPSDNAENLNIVKVVNNSNSEAIYFSRSVIPYNFKSRVVEYYNTIGLFYWNAKSLNKFSNLPISKLELIEDTHMLRMIENNFKMKMIYTEINTIGVDVPEDILKVEEYFNN
jgi:3-deoxy-manno-octulosonate cytidylyltransferase (CMP-KDO synthetase)